MAVNNNTSIIRDWTVVAENFLAEKLGKAPEATFFRGHSAGAAIGRSFNSIPGWNVDHAGNKLFDGIFLSDTASGRGPLTWFLKAEVGEGGVTTLVETEVDAMTFDEEHRAGMAKTIETMHAAYIGGDFVHTDWKSIHAGEDADRVIPSYTELKRDLARILVEKDLNADLWRFYEIADVGHNDAANERNTWPENAAEMIDVGGVYLPLKRALDRWATNGAEPPASRIDARDVTELDESILPQIRLPETACPRGFFHPYIARPDGKTSDSHQYFVPYHTVLHEQINSIEMDLPEDFDEAWLEPLDVNGFLVDVSGEGTRNTKLTIEQAWHARYRNGQTTGILKPYEELTRARYASCVNEVAEALYDEGLLSDEARDWYRWKGLNDPIMDDSAPLSANDCSAWESLGFRDEAQCTGFISTGKL